MSRDKNTRLIFNSYRPLYKKKRVIPSAAILKMFQTLHLSFSVKMVYCNREIMNESNECSIHVSRSRQGLIGSFLLVLSLLGFYLFKSSSIFDLLSPEHASNLQGLRSLRGRQLIGLRGHPRPKIAKFVILFNKDDHFFMFQSRSRPWPHLTSEAIRDRDLKSDLRGH